MQSCRYLKKNWLKKRLTLCFIFVPIHISRKYYNMKTFKQTEIGKWKQKSQHIDDTELIEFLNDTLSLQHVHNIQLHLKECPRCFKRLTAYNK